eukprot:scaffold318259_cov28-Tisochrysis_lutea.AAC.1
MGDRKRGHVARSAKGVHLLTMSSCGRCSARCSPSALCSRAWYCECEAVSCKESEARARRREGEREGGKARRAARRK